MKCPAEGCTRPVVTGGRRHEHAFAWGGGFELGQPVRHVESGEPVGSVRRLQSEGGQWSVWTAWPGQIRWSRWSARSLEVADAD